MIFKRIINKILKTQRLKPEEISGLLSQVDGSSISDYQEISVPACDEPKISVIIPVYNQFSYTYNCIRSICENVDESCYEIIVADDCSTDLTTDIAKICKGVRVEKTTGNCGFLLNCNNAAAQAKGKYLVFLNNDTQVRKGWLSALLSLMESDESIGLSGSKLIYPDGRLQEAGGIIWSDGTAANYGNGFSPLEPEFNYIKEVDYISGASIIIRSDVWKKVGGFDKRYIPAYCEDSDLAMRVRELGYKVVYQPFSEVIHFEGISNGRSLKKGLKQYQVVNQKTFYEKWKEILKENHSDPECDMFHARDRSRDKKTVFWVFCHSKEIGDAEICELEQMVSECLNVKVILTAASRRDDTIINLQLKGIEVLYGSYYIKYWKAWLAVHKRKNDQVIDRRHH